MSRTSLAKCFLCFWMLGMSTCGGLQSAPREKEQHFYVNEEHILLEIESAAL